MRAARNPKQVRVSKSGEARADILRDTTSPVTKVWSEPRALVGWTKPRVFKRVPTHVVGVLHERRTYPRAVLQLSLRLNRVAGRPEPTSVALLTRNISSSGVYFLCPQHIEPGTPIELEVMLVERPVGQGSVRMITAAHIVRVEPVVTPGWHGLAVSFDDISFQRDELIPPRFRQP